MAEKKEYKLDLFKEVLPALNRKDRDYFDKLSDEDKKAVTFFTLVRWISSVQGNADLVAYYLRNANICVNKHFYDVPLTLQKDHRKLMWLLMTAVSPGIGNQRHHWIKLQKESNPIKTQLENLFPNMKSDDAETLSKLVTKKELKKYVDGHGQESTSKRKSKM